MKKLKDKIIVLIPLINIIFPIISIEDILPWTATLIFMYLSYKKINEKNFSFKRIRFYVLCNGMIILIYNILVKIISDYLVKLLI